MTKKIIIAIGGGELRSKETNKIDRAIAELAKKRAGEKRANALFIPTASHDSLPYFNTFRKTYTSDFGLKADVALLTKKNIPLEKIARKIEDADMIYVGGGNTLFMLEVWNKTGVDKMILNAYNQGKIISGLSAGAICWFERMYTDSEILDGVSKEYKVYNGLGLIKGLVTPHYNERKEEFDKIILEEGVDALALEDNSAAVIEDGEITGALSSGGSAYKLSVRDGALHKEAYPLIEI